MKEKSYYIKTFGCQMNERDSEIMAQSLADYGFAPHPVIEEADLVILNTCSIRAKAEQKVMSLLGHLRKAKEKKPGMTICLAGCVAQQSGAGIAAKMPHVDLVLGTQSIYGLGEYLKNLEAGKTKIITDLAEDYVIPRFMPDPSTLSLQDSALPSTGFRKFVTIMQGCNNYCSYCVVPYTRGREVSRKIEDIVDEIKALLDGGVKEITLLGQNVNSYGKTNDIGADRGNYGFADLLAEVSALPGLLRLRFTTSNPKDLDDRLIDSFSELANLCPQFHLPVQSGSDRILRKMNRKYSVSEYLKKVDRLVEVCPSIALTSDIIVGFPGETQGDFQETMELLELVRFHGSFSFKYSDRPDTVASRLMDKVDEKVKSERLAVFQKRQDEISLERNREYLGQIKEVLLESVDHGSVRGRLDTNHIVHLEDGCDAKPGELVDAEIVHAGKHSLKGRLAMG